MRLHVHEWGDPAAAPLVCLHLEAVTVPGGHVVLWDAFAETADAVAEFVGAA